MSVKKLSVFFGILMVLSLILSACATPAQPAVPQVVTQIVEKEVEVEKIVTQVVETVKEVEKEVVVTPTPLPAEKVIRVNIGTYPDIIDPQKSSFVNEIAHLQMIYEGLTRLDKDLNTVPGAAEWKYSDDLKALTFTLREGSKYSDGSLLNAARYAYSIKRNIDPATAGEYAQITDEIAGAPEWRGCGDDAAACEAAMATVAESVKATHADGAACEGEGAAVYEDAACNTLTVTLSRPAPYFHTVMSLWVTFPAKEENISEGGENWWNSSKFQIGNGPYILTSLEPFVRGTFTPNPNYWAGVGKVNFDFSYITDTAVAFEAYKNDEFDIIGLAAEDLQVVQADPVLSEQAKIYPGSCTFALMFHQLKEPFTDQKVRQAFTQALDRETWVADVLQGLGAPTLTWIPKGYPGFDAEESRWSFDAEAAKAALAESSYGSVEALPAITATFGDTPRNRTRWEWLVAQWKEVLGVDIKLDPVEPTTFTALTKDIATSPQMFILGWCADYPDPQNWLSVYWRTGGFGERIAYSNADFDALVDAADTEADPTKRADLYAQAQTLLTDGVPVGFFWNNVNTYLVKPWVTGIVTTPQDSGFAGSIDPISMDIDTAALPQ